MSMSFRIRFRNPVDPLAKPPINPKIRKLGFMAIRSARVAAAAQLEAYGKTLEFYESRDRFAFQTGATGDFIANGNNLMRAHANFKNATRIVKDIEREIERRRDERWGMLGAALDW